MFFIPLQKKQHFTYLAFRRFTCDAFMAHVLFGYFTCDEFMARGFRTNAWCITYHAKVYTSAICFVFKDPISYCANTDTLHIETQCSLCTMFKLESPQVQFSNCFYCFLYLFIYFYSLLSDFYSIKADPDCVIRCSVMTILSTVTWTAIFLYIVSLSLQMLFWGICKHSLHANVGQDKQLFDSRIADTFVSPAGLFHFHAWVASIDFGLISEKFVQEIISCWKIASCMLQF